MGSEDRIGGEELGSKDSDVGEQSETENREKVELGRENWDGGEEKDLKREHGWWTSWEKVRTGVVENRGKGKDRDGGEEGETSRMDKWGGR